MCERCKKINNRFVLDQFKEIFLLHDFLSMSFYLKLKTSINNRCTGGTIFIDKVKRKRSQMLLPRNDDTMREACGRRRLKVGLLNTVHEREEREKERRKTGKGKLTKAINLWRVKCGKLGGEGEGLLREII